MENKFMYQLARKLMVHSSAHEMKEILEDYEYFSTDGLVSENPREIVNSLDESRHKALLFYALLGLFFLGNICMFAFIGGSYRLSFFAQDILLFFLILLFPPIVFWTIGNKLLLLSKFYSCNSNQRIRIYVAHLICLLMVMIYSFVPFGIMTSNLVHDPEYIVRAVLVIRQIFIGIAVLGTILFGYFALTKGESHYLITCNFYITLCTLFQIRANYSQLSSIDIYSRNLMIAVFCYFAGIAWSAIWLIILRRKIIR